MARALCVAILLASPVFAQTTYGLDRASNGTFGVPAMLQYTGATVGLAQVFLVDLGPGPTGPFPGITNIPLQVGSGAVSYLQLPVPAANGVANTLPLIASPAIQDLFHGWLLYSQAVTFPGAPTLIAQVSEPVRFLLGKPATPALVPGSATNGRYLACTAARIDPANGGREFLLAGGGLWNNPGTTVLASSELVAERTFTSRSGPTMQSPRILFASAVLLDGRVLITGGLDNGNQVISTCEIYNPVTNTFAPAASMHSDRAAHAAATLNDGRVVVVGGTFTVTVPPASLPTNLNLFSLEIYNPATNTWSVGAAMPALPGPLQYRSLISPALTKLPSGELLLSGGVALDVTLFPLPAASINPSSACYRIQPATVTFSSAAAMPVGVGFHHDNTLVLPNGDVLVTGGGSIANYTLHAVGAVQIYTPATNSWQSGTLPCGKLRIGHSATLMPTGTVWIAGGGTGTVSIDPSNAFSSLFPVADVLEFDPSTWVPGGCPSCSTPPPVNPCPGWNLLAPLSHGRGAHSAFLTNDGLLLLVGGVLPVGSGSGLADTTIEVLRF